LNPRIQRLRAEIAADRDAAELDAARLGDLQRTALAIGPAVREDLEQLDAFLMGVAAESL
jgi:hypothetical protein